jgi:hypothetical protein
VTDGRLYAAANSPAADLASGLAWLWRLGPLLGAPDARAIGVGELADAAELHSLVQTGRLAGAVVCATGAGPSTGPVPARRVASGVADLGVAGRLEADLTVFDGGEPLVRSNLGAHAVVVDGRTLILGEDAKPAWTLLRGHWTLAALARFLPDVLERPLVLLPAVGCARLDDIPGTAQHQVQGDAHGDRRQSRRVRAMARAYSAAGAKLNLAVAARALAPDERTQIPLEDVWPRSIAAIAAGVSDGAFEPVGHGYLHLDTDALERGEVEWREFARLDEREAGRRIDAVVEWQQSVLGQRPATFVAPAWGYSDGTLAAAAARGLPTWQRPKLGPLRSVTAIHETIDSAFRGLRGVGYEPFTALAQLGLPPTPVFHGGLFDLRMGQLKASRDVLSLARLAWRRDIVRLPSLRGLRWIGSGELAELLAAHDTITVEGDDVRLGEARRALLLGPGGQPARPAEDSLSHSYDRAP